MSKVMRERCFWRQSLLYLRLLALACIVSGCKKSPVKPKPPVPKRSASVIAHPIGAASSKPSASSSIPSQHKTRPHAYRRVQRRAAKHTAKPAPPPPPPPPAPVYPVYPIPPAHQPAVPANVQYVNHQLTIKAKNASLKQILAEVTRLTGMTVEGLNSDVRVYGQYGPETANQTLSTLLDGLPYNYVIIGGDATHPPRKLVLSISSK